MKPVLAFAILACVLGAACSAQSGAPAEKAAPAAAASPPADPGPPVATGVPEEFLGRWNTEARLCAENISEGRLTILPHHIEFYESGGPIEAVTVNSPREAIISAKLSGEGETWTDNTTFRLSEDGKSITDVSDPNAEQPFVRVRCP